MGEPITGNIIAKFTQGSEGELLAEQTDKLGIQWAFISLNSNTKMTESIIYTKGNYRVMGWILKNQLIFK